MVDEARLVEDARDVEQKLTEWRRARRPGEAIPEALWQMAARVAAKHSSYRVSRLLHLHYGDLKRRVDALGERRPSSSQAPSRRRKDVKTLAVQQLPESATFVEWLPSPVSPLIASCAIQVESSRGARMRIEMHQVPPAAVAELVRNFAD